MNASISKCFSSVFQTSWFSLKSWVVDTGEAPVTLLTLRIQSYKERFSIHPALNELGMFNHQPSTNFVVTVTAAVPFRVRVYALFRMQRRLSHGNEAATTLKAVLRERERERESHGKLWTDLDYTDWCVGTNMIPLRWAIMTSSDATAVHRYIAGNNVDHFSSRTNTIRWASCLGQTASSNHECRRASSVLLSRQLLLCVFTRSAGPGFDTRSRQ